MKTNSSIYKFSCFLLMLFISACQSATLTPTGTPSAEPTQTSVPTPTDTPTPVPTSTEVPVPLGERSYNDRPDDFPNLYQVHFVYVLPADVPDQQRDLDGKINRTIDAVNSWFIEQSGGSKIRFDTYQGELDITFVQMDMTTAVFYRASVFKFGGTAWILDILEERLLGMNLFKPGKIYVALFEIDKHPSTCAEAVYRHDLIGRLAGLYPSAVVEAGWNCADEEHFGVDFTYTDMGVIHEIIHLLGFASSCGKNPTSTENISHTGDFNNDLMWAPDAASAEYWDTDNMQLDPGNDDYFKHSIPNCPDLANSAFLEPLPEDPETPLGWRADWKLP